MREAFAEYAERLRPPSGSLAESVDDVTRFLERGGALIAWIGREAVGTARFEPADGFLYVGRVSVLPRYRRRGIASALMAAAETEAASHGLACVRVGVRQSLAANLALYRKLGYETVEVAPHPKGGDQIVWLRKRIDPLASSVP